LWKKEPVKKATLSHYQQHLLYGGHKLGLSLDICVQDQLCLWHRLYPLSRQTLKETLDFWGLGGTQHQKIIHLSQGQQKRLSLSRCSWMSRPLWILDEPEAGLDHVGQGNLKALMASHLKAGGMIVHATHQRLDDASGTIHEIVL
jgi:heme exporter protein A